MKKSSCPMTEQKAVESVSIPELFKNAWMTPEKYQRAYKESIEQPELFWTYKANKFIQWFKPWDNLYQGDFTQGDVSWFQGAKLNACFNCIDKHLPEKAAQTAFLWEGNKPEQQRTITYQQLHDEVCRLANALKSHGVQKGDRVCIYMPMIPEVAFAMLACARIGAIHSVVFGGFSPQSLRERILDVQCRILITADEGIRGGKHIPLKNNADEALKECPGVETVIVVRHTGSATGWRVNRDYWYHELTQQQPTECKCEVMDSEDPLFILYTSGSTGKPKGVLHSTAGYILHAAMTHHYVFDYHQGDVFWCAADVGWITGHTYIVYGPLINGAVSVMYEGLPYWPDASRVWEIVDRYKVNIFYTAPTVIRALMAKGDEFVARSSRKSLRLLGSVGEPINPEAWNWYHRIVGEKRCPIVDTWWQTETGGAMISPLPGATSLKPGSATRPFPGIQPALVDDDGNEIEGEGHGNLVIKHPWPSQIRTVYGNHQRMKDTYFSQFPGYYFTGDGARRDKDGYYWITGRVDDVLNTSGHRLGTVEIENALVLHESVAEAAVVGVDHPVKGEAIYAFVTPMNGITPSENLETSLKETVCKEIGSIARPEVIQWTPSLPKTRSGKIVRRILRKIANGETSELGDTSTLADPSVIHQLLAQ